MPSPFPGMDPYLEDPSGWTEVHQRLITTLSTELNRRLPAQYLARMSEISYREVFVEIFSMRGQHRLITVIEVISPANKAPGSDGRRLYLTKQREVLASQTHLMEIDLLRRGEHTVAPPIDSLLREGHWNYLVSLHRGGQEERFEVWPIPRRERLPRIHVPSAEDDADVVLDLQAVLSRCYDEGAYARALDYRQGPPIPLPREDTEWADALLRERGLRS